MRPSIHPMFVKEKIITKTRKVFALLTAFILVISLTSPVFAADTRGSYIGEIVVWLCVSKDGDAGYDSLNGHAWLIIQNASDLALPIGSYTMSPDETITLGAFNTRSPATTPAVWVNLESKFVYNDESAYSDAVALKLVIDASEFTALSDAIDTYSDKLFYPTSSQILKDPEILEEAYTCVDFALDVWHAIGGTRLSVTTAPKTTAALWDLIDEKVHYSPSFPSYSPYTTTVTYF